MALFGLIKDDKYYVKISINTIEVIDVVSGRSIKEMSNVPFSNERLLFAEFDIAEVFIKRLVVKLNGKLRTSFFLVHPVELNEGGVSSTEKRIFEESFERANGRLVVIWEGKELSNKEVLSEFERY
jgi:hypothetical protein